MDLSGEPSPEDFVLGLEELDVAAKLIVRGRRQESHQRMKQGVHSSRLEIAQVLGRPRDTSRFAPRTHDDYGLATGQTSRVNIDGGPHVHPDSQQPF